MNQFKKGWFPYEGAAVSQTEQGIWKEERNMQQTWVDYLIIALYFIAVIGIGVYCARGRRVLKTTCSAGGECRFWLSGWHV